MKTIRFKGCNDCPYAGEYFHSSKTVEIQCKHPTRKSKGWENVLDNEVTSNSNFVAPIWCPIEDDKE